MSKKLSVVTTVYNGQQYFDRAIPSILNQTYSNFEWIIVDDGSTDATSEMLAKVAQKDSRVKIFTSGHLGRTKALNYAIEKAQGEYIANQDFDDISYPERLSLQVEFLDAHPEVGVVGCNYIVEDENRKERYVRMPATEHDQLIKTMAKCVPFAFTLATFRKQALLQAGGYPDVEGGVEDLRLWITFAKHGWLLASIPENLGTHWVHPKSFFHRNFEYSYRQKQLAGVQWQAIRELNLPLWMGIYPIGRFVYLYAPNQLKSFVRRLLGGSKEKTLEYRKSGVA
ncbi:glycosyltransferase [Anabaena sp. UHCC 0187]|uniref:glycosyltransferase family 2 protein n=1 Tax=Anabaena sp. UHCC 0187 TaxID=2590018 RepID=UPI001446FC60|nr:glycosyltransferase family 2 protein [Anabaena sp. UHCC 0187]MTJ12919.1 glycosyltransferase [Anabaena sp. UHCC 0187]